MVAPIDELSRRLALSGVDAAVVGGELEDRERLLGELSAVGLVEVDGRGALAIPPVTRQFLEHEVEALAAADLAVWLERLDSSVAADVSPAEQLLDRWASPLRLAVADLIAARMALPRPARLAASELVVRLYLADHLQQVVAVDDAGTGIDDDAQVDPEQLLGLLTATGVVTEDGDDGFLRLTPAYTAYREHKRVRSAARRAPERRVLLGELLLLEGDALSEAFRLAGFPDSVAELSALHRFTALASLPLWTAWRSLTAFERGFETVTADSLPDWLEGDVIVMISSPHSRPAQELEIVLGAAASGTGLPVGVVNADTERSICERFDVDRPPMILLLRDGEVLDRRVWTSSAVELRLLLAQVYDSPLGPDAVSREHLPLV